MGKDLNAVTPLKLLNHNLFNSKRNPCHFHITRKLLLKDVAKFSIICHRNVLSETLRLLCHRSIPLANMFNEDFLATSNISLLVLLSYHVVPLETPCFSLSCRLQEIYHQTLKQFLEAVHLSLLDHRNTTA